MKDIKVFKVCLAHKIKVCKMKKPFTVPGSLSHLPALPKPHGFIYPPEPVLHRSQHALGQACSQLAHRTDPQSTHTIARSSRTQPHISPLARAAAALHRRSCPGPRHTRQRVLTSAQLTARVASAARTLTYVTYCESRPLAPPPPAIAAWLRRIVASRLFA